MIIIHFSHAYERNFFYYQNDLFHIYNKIQKTTKLRNNEIPKI